MKSSMVIVAAVILLFNIAGCNRDTLEPKEPSGQTIVVELIPTITIVSTPLIVPTATTASSSTRTAVQPTITLTTSPPIPLLNTWITLTPMPPVKRPEAKATVDQFFQKPPCDLPCWWGIEPGKTSYEDVNESLFPLASIVALEGFNSDAFALQLFFPGDENGKSSNFKVDLTFREEILQYYSVSYPDSFPIKLKEFMKEYGEPGEVRIVGEYYSAGEIPFHIYINHPEIAVISSFTFNALDAGASIRICPENAVMNNLSAGIPDEGSPRQIGLGGVALQEATGVDIGKFYQMIINSPTQKCLNAPKSLLW